MVLAFVWLAIGAVTAGQRNYFDNVPATCAHIGTIAVTVFAGPLNLFGMNPQIDNCHFDLPQPGQ